MNKTIIIIIVVLVLGIGGYFLFRGGYQAPTQALTPAPEATPGTVEEKTVSEAKEFTVLGNEYSFSPSSISVKAGDQVKIVFQNTGRAPHNLIIEDLGIGTKTIGGGKTDIIEFVASNTGTYTFFCSVGAHRAAGMVGSLEVE